MFLKISLNNFDIFNFLIQFKEHWNQIFISYTDIEKRAILSQKILFY